MSEATKRWLLALWLSLLLVFAVLHALFLSADFPNHSPWYHDWAKYTDEGWYGNAAIRAHLLGHWYLPGDFNPAVALPALPFLEWVLFFATGVTLQAARGLAVACFFANLLLAYFLLRARVPRQPNDENLSSGASGAALLAVTLLVTSPFVYCFSRVAILEPLLTTWMLAALNLAVRLPRLTRPRQAAASIGLLFTLMMLTKTTAVFLAPAIAFAMLLPLRSKRKLAVQCAAAAALTSAAAFGFWMAVVAHAGLMADYRYLFDINTYPKPAALSWPLVSFWWSFHGGLWVDRILIPLAGVIVLGALLALRTAWGRELVLDPVFGTSVLAVAGYILFMTVQNHPQPRYFAIVAFFSFLLVAEGAGVLLDQSGVPRQLGWGVIAVASMAAVANAAWTLSYAVHPEHTFVQATQELARYIDQHPNGNRLLVATSGDEIMLAAHVPALCDDFGTLDLPQKLARYQPGWFATWNDLDPGTLADLHTHFSVEQAASFHALDDPDRNVLVLFKLHPLPNGKVRDEGDQNLQIQLPGDRFDIPIQ